MDCEQTREELMSLPSAAFDGLAHLRTCPACRAFADRLRAADGAMAAHVETFAAAGDFASDWKRAMARARRRIGFGSAIGLGSATGIGLLALAATALLILRPAPDGPEPAISEPSAAPVVAPPPAVAPPPVVAVPPPAIAPPVEAPRPRPPAPAPAPIPPRLARPPAEAPRAIAAAPAAPAPGRRSVVVRIDPALPDVRTAELTCGDTGLRAARSGDTIRFDGVPDGPCTIGLGSAFRGPLAPGDRWRLGRVDGALVLVPDP